MRSSLLNPIALFAQQSAGEPGADTTGLIVVLVILGALAGVAFALTRKPPRRLPPAERDEPASASASRREEDSDARQRAKALRRAARGGVKVDKRGKVERIEALDFAGPAELEGEEEVAEVAAPPPAAPVADDRAVFEAEQRAKLETGLARTRQEGFVARLGKLFAGKQIDDQLIDQIEEVLFRADVGVQAAEALLAALKDALSRKDLADAARCWQVLRERSTAMLEKVGRAPLELDAALGPAVLMVVGVNGSGKTTTIGKLAHRYAGQGRRVLVVAGDTFRAAAVEQLAVWCDRAGVDLHRGKDKADPAAVAFDGVERAKTEGFDLVIVDTAGRLHTNENLMRELQKTRRVIGKAHPGAPHETVLVLDATMGQNAVQQARVFKESLEVTAIALTKLDGTAKGGVVLAIAETLSLPVKLVGVGESMEDLRDFDPALFVEALYAQG